MLTFYKIIFLVSLLSIGACSQPDQQRSASIPAQRTRLDSVVTTQQAQRLLRTQPGLQTFMLSDSLGNSIPDKCASRPTCVAPGALKSWLKADFDGNGRVDLLVTGYANADAFRREVICFLDSGKHILGRVSLTDEKHKCGVPQLITVKGQPAIRYASYQMDNWRAHNARLICQADTLVFDKTQFIENNAAPRNYQIQRIAFNTTACYGMCPVFSLHLDHSGKAVYQAQEYNEVQGNFNAIVDTRKVAELWALLNYLDFPNLKDNYDIGVTDQPTCRLTITYADGKVKTIKDYGEQGTFGLSRAYELLFALRTNQQWR